MDCSMLPMDLTGATVIVAKPGDTLTFVTRYALEPWDEDQVLAHLRTRFPGIDIGFISTCEAVIHEPKPE
jgi:hypothetical protein